ncbi:MAG: alpha-L-fucosidase [Oscillospiraceae bacterium]|nr:alpha-L-fucosidase [Oscillospiraceae bacterium]
MSKGYENTIDIKPSKRQLDWAQNDYYGMVSFSMGTFTGKQVGDGYAVPDTFAPEDIDTDEWAKLASKSGMSGLLITAKSYDGFCIWQTESTDYSVKNSSWMNGGGDVVGMLAESCRKYGLKFGINMTVWDRHEPAFRQGNGYNGIFKKQIEELLTNYGELFEVRIDDACGENMTFEFDYKGVFTLIRKLQPNAVISYCGPDVRWVGNDRGFTRKEEWSVIPAYYRRNEDGTLNAPSKKTKSNEMILDLGSRKAVKRDSEFVWYPCEVNVNMRDHAFYLKDDNYSVKTKDKLHRLYLSTIGSNSAFLLNISPDKRGHIFDTDSQILTSFGHDLKVMFGYNLLKESSVSASSFVSELYSADNIISDDTERFWRAGANDKKPELIIKLNGKDMFDKVVIREHIANGQHVEKFKVFVLNSGKWTLFGKGTVIGNKCIIANKPAETDSIKIVFEKYRGFIEISSVIIN